MLRNLPDCEDLTMDDFESVRTLLRERVVVKFKEISDCHVLQHNLDLLHRLPSYLHILDDTLISTSVEKELCQIETLDDHARMR
jgi:hypothetical protein